MLNSGRSIAVALNGTADDEGLVRYAAMVAHLSCGAGPLGEELAPAEELGSLAEPHLGTGMAVAKEKRSIVLTAPRELRLLQPAGAADALLRAAADEDTAAVLVGEDAGKPGRRRLARQLIRESPSSVWFVPEGSEERIRRILVPSDYSTRAADSLRVATSLGRLAGAADCLALNVYFNASPFAIPGQDQCLLARLVEAHAAFMANVDSLGVAVTPCFREGANVGRTAARVAEEEAADLIVMASRGRTAASALVLESVAEQTLLETRVPLLVVKHFGPGLGLLGALREKLFHRMDEVRFN